ncbi:MAG: chorismate mutase [Gemmatimonas sp.]
MSTAVRTLRRATLEDLRAEIDAIDESLHDLLMRRAGLAADIARLKSAAPGAGGAFFRPGREAAVIRRILARHRGAFPAAALVRIWREMMSALLGLQAPLTFAAGTGALVEIAREHFGSGATLVRRSGPVGAVRAVAHGRATAAVVPWPAAKGDGEWWRALLKSGAPRVVAALPVVGVGPQAVVVAAAAPEPSGDDRTFVAVSTPRALTRPKLGRALDAAGLEGGLVVGHAGVSLIDVSGFLSDSAPSLRPLALSLGAKSVRVLGAYACPFRPRGDQL